MGRRDAHKPWSSSQHKTFPMLLDRPGPCSSPLACIMTAVAAAEAVAVTVTLTVAAYRIPPDFRRWASSKDCKCIEIKALSRGSLWSCARHAVAFPSWPRIIITSG
ncbi:hypothetical protein B0I35DRAFT_410931 [Stachybotrys elegans]|uniref:Uncharacterized protein n=1 Tax=Stachybotrys elegans TaxID=80388 RepID=A0A8K0WNE1_9HYPO|nr:hypothetical protein B0I35DRAFT_410931 [Stachybotrys elegans]